MTRAAPTRHAAGRRFAQQGFFFFGFFFRTRLLLRVCAGRTLREAAVVSEVPQTVTSKVTVTAGSTRWSPLAPNHETIKSLRPVSVGGFTFLEGQKGRCEQLFDLCSSSQMITDVNIKGMHIAFLHDLGFTFSFASN